MATVIYNCRRCRVGRRVEYPKENRAARAFYREDRGGAVRIYPGDRRDIACPKCAKPMRWNYLQATLVESVACNAICEGARGASCTCSCGGKNHGRAWA